MEEGEHVYWLKCVGAQVGDSTAGGKAKPAGDGAAFYFGL